mmetsp:Transcript_74611/g.199742  ORF Transcript_74611/g.199742 Transcript_74611/m.199742 type:complete len:217 (+) Transcript_74611:546-1196(+)
MWHAVRQDQLCPGPEASAIPVASPPRPRVRQRGEDCWRSQKSRWRQLRPARCGLAADDMKRVAGVEAHAALGRCPRRRPALLLAPSACSACLAARHAMGRDELAWSRHPRACACNGGLGLQSPDSTAVTWRREVAAWRWEGEPSWFRCGVWFIALSPWERGWASVACGATGRRSPSPITWHPSIGPGYPSFHLLEGTVQQIFRCRYPSFYDASMPP